MGLILGLIAAFLGAAKDVVSKRLSTSVDGTTSAFASFAYAIPHYLILLFVLWFLGLEDFAISGMFWWYMIARSVSDTGAETCKMHALARGEISVVTALVSLHPVFMLFTSPLITGDPLTLRIIFGVCITVSGSLVILLNRSIQTSKSAIMFALMCALFFSINSCFDRLSVQSASAPFSAFTMTALAGVMLLPTIFIGKRYKSLNSNTKPFLLRGFFEVIFMTTKLFALQYLQAPELSAIVRVQLLFAVISGNVLFKEINFWRKFFGAVLTVTGIAIILLK